MLNAWETPSWHNAFITFLAVWDACEDACEQSCEAVTNLRTFQIAPTFRQRYRTVPKFRTASCGPSPVIVSGNTESSDPSCRSSYDSVHAFDYLFPSTNAGDSPLALGSYDQFAFNMEYFSKTSIAAGPPGDPTRMVPIFRAGIDSCCTASCTDSRERLTNIRACDETFKAANGKKSKCDSIGDMPVLAKDTTGRIFRFVLKNVRYVPEFKYTLLSVNQLWNEQGINATFADAKHLVFPDGAVVPFDPRFALCAVTMVTERARPSQSIKTIHRQPRRHDARRRVRRKCRA